MKYLKGILFFCLISQNLISQITGKVTDLETGASLTGAHVVLYYENGLVQADQSITGKSGEFIFSGTYSDQMNLVVSYIGYNIYRSSFTAGDSPHNFQIALVPSVVSVGEVTVNAQRKEKNLMNVSIPIAIVTSQQMDRMGGFTPADMLNSEPGISMSRDGIWATSLNIRGLTEERIVVLVDGNRVETATDVAAAMAMIDINDIQRIEVIKGAASSLYGTGALGGVVNIITKSGHYSDGFYAESGITGAYQSVNNMHSENAGLGLGDENWYMRIAGTFRDADNTMTPEGPLENSQFRDNNLSLKMGLKPILNHEIKINYQRFYAKDVGIPGGEAFPVTATATYSNVLRNMLSVAYKIKSNGKILNDTELKYFHQYILRDVILKPNPSSTITPSGYHTTNGLQLQSNLSLPLGHSIIAGIDLWQRQVETTREKNIFQSITDSAGNVTGTNHIIRGEMPIPSSTYGSAGVFIHDELKYFKDRLTLNFGGRFDLINVRNNQSVDPLYIIMNGNRNDNPPNQRITFSQNDVYNYSWSANFGSIYKINPDLDLTTNLSRAFRSPSLEERFKYIDLNTIVKIGDPDLKPEEGYFADLGLRLWKDKLQFSINFFVNSMSDLIVESPGTVVYNYTSDPELNDTIPAYINTNVDKALLYGSDMSFEYNFFGQCAIFGSASFIRGEDLKNKSHLPSIPPFNGRIGMRYQAFRWIRTEIVANLFDNQERIATGENPTKGYSYYDFRISSSGLNTGFGKLSIYGGIENLTNRAFINHLASNRGLIKYEPGRNFYVRLKVEF